METKLSKLKAAFLSGDHVGALRIAAKFHDLGDHKVQISTAWAALNNPDFYREIGKNPEDLVSAGIDAIRERYAI